MRYAATCTRCGLALPASTKAWWDGDDHTTTCLDCAQLASGDPDPTTTATPVDPEALREPSTPLEPGQAGASARAEYEKRHERRDARIDQRWGRLAGVVKFLSDDPQSTTAWGKGSDGERRLADRLAKRVGDRAVLLHDRKVPKTRGNIDHLAIAPSGIWVIDAKTYKGTVERRDKGGLFRTDYRLYVGGHDRTRLVEGLGWQVEAVRTALAGDDVAINAALCFIDAEWGLFSKPFQLNGAWVTWGKKLAELIATPGPLTGVDVLRVAARLATALPSAVPTT